MLTLQEVLNYSSVISSKQKEQQHVQINAAVDIFIFYISATM